jgi:DNA-binding transcriptional MocR family regulator
VQEFVMVTHICLGLCCSWMEATPNLLQQLCKDGVLNSGGSIAPLASGIAHSCLELGLLQQHLHKVIRPSLAEGCAAVCDALRTEMPGCSFQQPLGGYFVWVQLPQEVRAVRGVPTYDVVG